MDEGDWVGYCFPCFLLPGARSSRAGAAADCRGYRLAVGKEGSRAPACVSGLWSRQCVVRFLVLVAGSPKARGGERRSRPFAFKPLAQGTLFWGAPAIEWQYHAQGTEHTACAICPAKGLPSTVVCGERCGHGGRPQASFSIPPFLRLFLPRTHTLNRHPPTPRPRPTNPFLRCPHSIRHQPPYDPPPPPPPAHQAWATATPRPNVSRGWHREHAGVRWFIEAQSQPRPLVGGAGGQ